MASCWLRAGNLLFLPSWMLPSAIHSTPRNSIARTRPAEWLSLRKQWPLTDCPFHHKKQKGALTDGPCHCSEPQPAWGVSLNCLDRPGDWKVAGSCNKGRAGFARLMCTGQSLSVRPPPWAPQTSRPSCPSFLVFLIYWVELSRRNKTRAVQT